MANTNTYRDFSVQRSASPAVTATERAADTNAFDVTRAYIVMKMQHTKLPFKVILPQLLWI